MDVTQVRQSRTHLMDLLWEVQRKKRFIGDADVRKLAKEVGISTVCLEGVISFYHFFHRQPTGKYTIYLNNSMVSEVKGFAEVKKAFEKETGAEFGSVDASGTFGLFETPCIGLSDQEPAALVNFQPFTNLTPAKVKELVANLRKGKSPDKMADEIEHNIQYTPGDKTVLLKDYFVGSILKKMSRMDPLQVIDEMKKSGLSGRGGAFFPTGLKWQFCRNSMGMQKYIVCNADEGEPGTFKDRVLMSEYPELLLEGMIIAGYAVGASKGIIYLRAEYHYLKEKLEAAIEKFKNIGLLGQGVLGLDDFDFDMRIQMGAGAYVCGEETALLESLEGKRGIPRTKIFFPVEKGFLNKPTIINNVETFCAAARIIEMGGEKYKSLGTGKTPGTKLLSISGNCEKPGIYEVEWGITVREMLDLCGAKDPHFMQISGPSGNVISKEDLDRKICGEDLLCGGSVMLFDSKTEVFDILKNFSDFFIHESCGFCTPCRAGNYLVGKKLEKILDGLAFKDDLEDIKEWSKIIISTSRCGLGKTSTKFLIEAMEKFPEAFAEKAPEKDSGEQKFDLEGAVHDYIDFVNEINTKHG